MSRRAELAAALNALQERLAAACSAAGRPREDVRLVAVTKTWPASDVVLLHELGVTDVGENKDQEAAAKAAELAGTPSLRWHFVGQVQRNKARSIASYAHVVHSLDRAALVPALSAGAVRAGRTLDVLVQVALGEDEDEDAGRAGVRPDAAAELADLAAGAEGLRLAGVMAVAPRGADPGAAFARLAVCAGEVRSRHPGAVEISAGMSGDLEQAVANGATLVRVGTALLGLRPPLLR